MKIQKKLKNMERIDKEIKYLKTHGIIVGIFGEEGNKMQDGVTIGYYAKCLNYGTSKMGKKPFFFESVGNKESIEIIKDKQREILRKIYFENLTAEEGLNQLGIFIKQRIQDKIMNNNYKNDPKTIARKKRNKNNTLRENDFLLNSVSYQIIRI